MYKILFLHIIIDVISLATHSFGLFLLLYKVRASQNFSENQRYLLIQLSLGELIYLLLFSMSDGLTAIVNNGGADNITLTTMLGIVNTILNLPCFLVLIIAMLAITIDRFLSVYLNIRYPPVCTLKSVKIILGVCRVLILLLAILILVFYQQTSYFDMIAKEYVWPLSDGLFLIVAFVTYTYFLKKIKENRNKVKQITSSVTTKKSLRSRTLLKSFFVPSILIGTFILFIVIPDQVFFWYNLLEVSMHIDVEISITMLFKLCYLSDAVVYIFLQKEIFRCAKNVILSR